MEHLGQSVADHKTRRARAHDQVDEQTPNEAAIGGASEQASGWVGRVGGEATNRKD